MYRKHSLTQNKHKGKSLIGSGLYYFGEGRKSLVRGGCPPMEIEIVGNGLTPFGGGITPFGSGITPFGGKRMPPRKLPKMLGGNFSNDARSPTALNKSQLAQLKELPKKSPVPVFDRHSLNLLNNVVQSKQIIEGGGMRVYK